MDLNIHSIHYKELLSKLHRLEPLELQVTDQEKVTIISDCHLDQTFNAQQYAYLEQVIDASDQFIINGDFWADKHISFDAFVSSPWSRLFPKLKEKNTYYIFGNHDMPALCDERMDLFCTHAGFQLKLKAGNLSFHIEHGHLLSPQIVLHILQLFEFHPQLLSRLTRPVGIFNEIALDIMQATNSTIAQRINRSYKKKRLCVSQSDEYFVMGHTHVSEYDEKKKYINLGRTHGRQFSYLTIHQNTFHLHTSE